MSDMLHWNEFVKSVLSGKQNTPDKDNKGEEAEKGNFYKNSLDI